MSVNITILVRDRPRLTEQALLSLSRTQRAKDNTTILDDRSKPETMEILRSFQSSHCSVVRNDIAIGTGAARNRVIRESEQIWGRGTYLYLSDNDVFFHPFWLDRVIKALTTVMSKGFAVIGAYGHPYHIPGDIYPVDLDYCVREVNALATQSMFMRWEVWDEYGPFCQTPTDKVCQSEDVDFCNRIRAGGYKIGVVSPALIVSTGITNTFGEKIPGWELVKAQAPIGVIVE